MMLAFLTFALLLAGAGAADAGPLVAIPAIALGLKIGTLAYSIVTTITSIAISIGVSLLQAALAKKNRPKQKEPGVNFEVQIGDDNPIAFPMGTYATAGTRKYQGVWGNAGETPNAYLVDVIQFSDIPVTGIDGLWVNGEKVTFDTSAGDIGLPVIEYQRDGTDYLWVRVVDGTQSVVDPYLAAKFGAHADRPWENDMIGRGCAYIVITARHNRELFQGRYPQILIEPSQPVWYDPRLDSTNGGSGTHDWDDPSTWDVSDNPAVLIYNIIKGVHYVTPGSPALVEWVYGGKNMSPYRLPSSNWIAAMNACDTLVDLADETQEKAYRAGYEVRGDMEPLEVIEQLLKACNGRLAEIGGQFKIKVGDPGASVFAFTDDDIVVTREQDYRPFPRLDETVNGIEATYPEPIEMWGTRDAPPIYSTALETEDGRRLSTGVQLPACPFGTQVQRVMNAMIEEERRFALHVIVLPPDAWVLEPLDVVSWTSTRNGYTAKKFLVISIIGEPGMNQVLSLKEIDPSDYEWTTDDEQDTDVTPVTPERPDSQAIVDWAASAVTLVGDDGSKRVGIELTWETQGVDDVDSVLFEVRLASDESAVHSGSTANVSAGSVIITQGLVRNTEYEVRGKYVSVSGRPFDWTSWLSVTTGDIPLINVVGDLGPETVNYSSLAQAMKGAVDARIQAAADFETLKEQIEQLAAQSTQGEVDNRQRIEYTLHKTDYGLAVATRSLTAVSTANSANASAITAVEARLDTGDVANAISILQGSVERTEKVVEYEIWLKGANWFKVFPIAGLSILDDFYNDATVTVVDGADAGSVYVVTDYDGATRKFTLDASHSMNPADTVRLGMYTVISAEASRLDTVSTTVDGHTSSLTDLLQAVDGSSFKWALVGEIDGVTGGLLLTGAVAPDGSVSRTFAVSADKVQFGDFNNYIRNGEFDADGATVDPSAGSPAVEISDWYITSGHAQIDVLEDDDSGVPASAPTDYVLKLNTDEAFELWNQMDPNVTGAFEYGTPVRVGEIVRVKLQAATAEASVNTAPNIRVAVLDAAGTVTYQNKATLGVSVGNTVMAFAGESSDGWVERSQDFIIAEAGRAFVEIYDAADTDRDWYFTQVSLFRRNGVELIVDGSIQTQLVNENAITDTVYGATATGSDDKAGTGLSNYHTIVSYDYAVTLPYNYAAWIVFECMFGMTYSGANDFNSVAGIEEGSLGENTGNSYGGTNQTQAIGTTRMALAVTGTGNEQTFHCKAYWSGKDSNITCVGRDYVIYVFKR